MVGKWAQSSYSVNFHALEGGRFSLGNGEGEAEQGQRQWLWIVYRSRLRTDLQRALLRKQQN